MAASDKTLDQRLEEFHEKSNEGAWANLFLLARMRAKAEGIGILQAITQELDLRL